MSEISESDKSKELCLKAFPLQNNRANLQRKTDFVNPGRSLYTFCMRKKLLVISPFLGRSGMERNLAYFFEQYPRAQFEIGFVYFERLYPKTQTSPLEESLQHISQTWQIKIPNGLGLFEVGMRLTHLIEEWQPEVILGKEWFAACAAVFARGRLSLTAATHPRIVALIENDPQMAFLEQIKKERLTRVKRVVYKHLLKQADLVIGVSRGVTQEAKRVFGISRHKLRTVYNGVDLALVKQQASLPSSHRWLKPELHHTSGIPVIVSCARLSPEKDLDTLIRAVALVHKKRRVRAIIVGSGKELVRLRRLSKRLGVSANIDFTGYSPNPFSLMSRADAFVMTSLSEGFPSVLLEAMACEVPVIYTDCRFGPEEIIDHGKNGLLVPVGQPAAVAEAIEKILNDYELRKKLVHNASHIIKQFTVQKAVQELSHLL